MWLCFSLAQFATSANTAYTELMPDRISTDLAAAVVGIIAAA